ncbi:nuclear transport factor 2 family protein [Spirosoma aerophilum]
MKTILLTLALFFLITGSFAQSANTAEVETALKEFITEYNKSPYDFFKNRLTDDFRYFNGNGGFSFRSDVLKENEGRPSLQSEVSDLKVLRAGDLGIVSGIHSFGGDGKVAFTYTLVKQKGNGSAARWMFAMSQHTPIPTTKK